MRWYRILTRIVPILSVVDFALAAPVVVREHEVRVSVVGAAKDGTAPSIPDKWLANATGRTNAPPIPRSSDSVHWREQEQEPRQYDPYNPQSPSPPADPASGSTSPSPTSQAPTFEADPLNPPSPHGNTDLNLLIRVREPTDDSDR